VRNAVLVITGLSAGLILLPASILVPLALLMVLANRLSESLGVAAVFAIRSGGAVIEGWRTPWVAPVSLASRNRR
jgi:hypothetical protein